MTFFDNVLLMTFWHLLKIKKCSCWMYNNSMFCKHSENTFFKFRTFKEKPTHTIQNGALNFNFSSHLLPPTYVNFYSSFLQIKQLILVPNLEQIGGTLSKSWNYKILWSERMLKVANFTIPLLKVQNSFCSTI